MGKILLQVPRIRWRSIIALATAGVVLGYVANTYTLVFAIPVGSIKQLALFRGDLFAIKWTGKLESGYEMPVISVIGDSKPVIPPPFVGGHAWVVHLMAKSVGSWPIACACILAFISLLQGRMRRNHGLCVRCLYPQVSGATKCPECGRSYE